MKKLILFLTILSSISFTYGATNCRSEVTMNLSTQQWLALNDAQITININATANSKDITNIQQNISSKLTTLAPHSEWHLITFTQKKNDSGLYTIKATSQSRLSLNEINTLTENLEALNKAGMQFSVDKTEYTPGDAQLNQAKTSLRQSLYSKSKAELQLLNETYPNSHYVMNKIYFDSYPRIIPLGQEGMRYREQGDKNKPTQSMSQQIAMSARVTFAAGCQYDK